MRFLQPVLLLLLAVNFSFAQNQIPPLKFKAEIGFIKAEDKFERYKFVEDGKKVVFVGKNNLQIWDVKSLTQINNLRYSVTKYDDAHPIQKIVTLGVGFKWETIEIDPNGRWFVSFEGEALMEINTSGRCWIASSAGSTS